MSPALPKCEVNEASKSLAGTRFETWLIKIQEQWNTDTIGVTHSVAATPAPIPELETVNTGASFPQQTNCQVDAINPNDMEVSLETSEVSSAQDGHLSVEPENVAKPGGLIPGSQDEQRTHKQSVRIHRATETAERQLNHQKSGLGKQDKDRADQTASTMNRTNGPWRNQQPLRASQAPRQNGAVVNPECFTSESNNDDGVATCRGPVSPVLHSTTLNDNAEADGQAGDRNDGDVGQSALADYKKQLGLLEPGSSRKRSLDAGSLTGQEPLPKKLRNIGNLAANTIENRDTIANDMERDDIPTSKSSAATGNQ